MLPLEMVKVYPVTIFLVSKSSQLLDFTMAVHTLFLIIGLMNICYVGALDAFFPCLQQ